MTDWSRKPFNGISNLCEVLPKNPFPGIPPSRAKLRVDGYHTFIESCDSEGCRFMWYGWIKYVVKEEYKYVVGEKELDGHGSSHADKVGGVERLSACRLHTNSATHAQTHLEAA
jgi:hypothetical protein